ncbi:MAG: pyruvate flavodoxin/ferredoxin oxidoreductase [Phycisphaerales bacterium]|nr:pyruvate flavodoxin/ferredoxin oxidoreductase [Phycisphaerales bacterium]MCB9856576.1 pyruvate flavodoxin/ferredoxin oxidoreductase [Phycisphaerales bacterium]MCB9864627.1 pyruvate flavodoxin/ferredoxin oxidoreductase [Phycisphaerales bacterium]
MREFMTGNQAVVRAAIRAGCNYFAGYPITPASSILTEFVKAFADGRGTIVQTEDEIAAIGQCIGAAMAGAKALTASSGPGLSLYSENIGLAQMAETPLVIVDCQRMGPSTGGATATGEGDVMFARFVSGGGYPLPVLAACDAATAYRLTIDAFNIAERFRTPVILLSSKDVALTRQTVDLGAIELPEVADRSPHDDGDGWRGPYAVDQPADIPRFAPIGGDTLVRVTGSIHDERGVLTNDRAKIQAKLTHLFEKIESRAEELERFDADIDPIAETLIICYGGADGAVREAVATMRERGEAISRLTLYTLWPIAARAIRDAVTWRVRRVIMPELNIGLYADALRPILAPLAIESIRRYDGGLISPETICEQAGNEAIA